MKKILAWLISPAVAGLIGIIGLAFAIYTAFFYERKPDLSISVDTISKVFDLYQPVGGLEVFYAEENLRSTKKNLWVLTATIKNVGNAEIRKVDYDDKVPLGLEIGGAVIAERPTLKTNIDYLANNLNISTTDNLISFSPVILEPGESFEVTTLLLGSESAKPSITPIGKLAGIKSISLSTPESPSPEKSIMRQAVDASSVWVHPIRWLVYFVGTYVAIGLLIAFAAAIISPLGNLRKQRKVAERQRQIRDYRQYEELGKESRYLMDEYVIHGEASLVSIWRYLHAHTQRRFLLDALTDTLDGQELEKLIRSAVPFRSREDTTEDSLKAIKLAEGDGVHVKVSEVLKEALTDLCRFLDIDLEKSSSTINAEGAKLTMTISKAGYTAGP